MRSGSVEEIYQRHIKPLSPSERLHLLAITAQDLAHQDGERARGPKRSIMDLHGLGAQIWGGVDGQEYVNELRNEWDRHP